MRSIPRPWRTLRGRLVLAAAAGLVTAAVVFAAVGAGLIRAQSQVVARAELDRQAEQLAKLVSTQAERALTRGTQVPSFEPSSIEALVGENTKLYYTGLALTPGSEQPTAEIPAVVASQIDYEVLERTGVQRIDFTQPGQQVVRRPRPRRSRSAASSSGRSCWRGPRGSWPPPGPTWRAAWWAPPASAWAWRCS